MIRPATVKGLITQKPVGSPVAINRRLLLSAVNIYMLQEQDGSVRAPSVTANHNLTTLADAPKWGTHPCGGQGILLDGTNDAVYNDASSGPGAPPFWTIAIFTPAAIGAAQHSYAICAATGPFGAFFSYQINSSGVVTPNIRFLDNGANATWSAAAVRANETYAVALISRGVSDHTCYVNGVATRSTTTVATGGSLRQRAIGCFRRQSSNSEYFNGVVHFAADGTIDPGEDFFVQFTSDPWPFLFKPQKSIFLLRAPTVLGNRRRRIIIGEAHV